MASDAAMRWCNESSIAINATLQLLVIYRYIDYTSSFDKSKVMQMEIKYKEHEKY